MVQGYQDRGTALKSSAQSLDFPIAILAGGLATRLHPITERIPKALVQVAGEPFLAHQLRLLRRHGLTRIVLCVGHLGEMIREEFGDGERWGVELQYSFDGARLLGTGGAIRRALPLLGDAFYVMYGDSYLPMDYQAAAEAWRQSTLPALMTVFRNCGEWDRSNVEYERGRVIRYDKQATAKTMHYIDYGLSVFSRGVFQDLPESEVLDLSVIQHDLAARGQLAGLEVRQRFYEIGSPAGLAELDQHLQSPI